LATLPVDVQRLPSICADNADTDGVSLPARVDLIGDWTRAFMGQTAYTAWNLGQVGETRLPG
jgi:hypothetical protein